MKNDNGFTLVEVLGIVVIIAVLVVMIVPKVSGYIAEGKDSYNENLKVQLLLSAKNFFSSDTKRLPIKLGDVYRDNRDFGVVSLSEI